MVVPPSCLKGMGMTRTHFWVGLDVGVDTTACCVIGDDGGVKLEQRLPTSAVALHSQTVPEKSQPDRAGGRVY